MEYEVHVPLRVQSILQLSGPGSEAYLRIYHHITDSDQRLFGFQDAAMREFFIALQSVKGLGTGLALSLMSHFEPAQFLDCCARKDVKALCHIPRVGKTTAETLIFEVNRRKAKWTKLLQEAGEPLPAGSPAPAASPETELAEQEVLAMQALVQLGYKENEAAKALEKLRTAEPAESEAWNAATWIERALRVL